LIDYHIHIHYSPCTSKEMSPMNVIAKAKEKSIHKIGLVNHLHPVTKIKDFQHIRKSVDEAAYTFKGDALLGAEAEVLDQKGASTIHEDIREYVDYVMLATGHYHLPWTEVDIKLPAATFLAREMESVLMILERHRVDVLAHPFLYATLHKVAPEMLAKLRPHELPHDMLESFAKKLKKDNIFLEYHCRDMLFRPERLGGEKFLHSYNEFISIMRQFGVLFVPGSDAHYLDQIGRTQYAPKWAHNEIKKTKKDNINV